MRVMLAKNLIEAREELSLNGLIATVDPGRQSISILKTLAVFGIRAIMDMQQHQSRFRPFVGRSYLSTTRWVESDNSLSASAGLDDDGDTNAYNSSPPAETQGSDTETD